MARARKTPESAPYVRFEDRAGRGLFRICEELPWELKNPRSRLRPVDKRELGGLYYLICAKLSAPEPRAYDDHRSRRPLTWFKTSAHELVALAERLCGILNRYGVDLRTVHARRPGLVLWEDEYQIVVRPPRRMRSTLREGPWLPIGDAKPESRARRDRTTIRLARGRRRLARARRAGI